MGEDPKNFHDVAHPNSTPQSSTSRPIIVDHEPIMQDPMMRSDNPPKPLARHSDEPKVQPQTLTAAPEALPPSEVTTELTSSIPKAVTEPKAAQGSKDEQDTKIEQLIESKAYAVPVGHLKRKRTLRMVLIIGGGILVVGAVAAYIIASR